ncbi:hypothetical protein ABGV42_01990 [Paenibacillus pabuli]|uniref:hypothetical protein n=1 Tax=Paenibacillus pabuli TaxID=1472 RepID=UPI003242A882
MSNLRSARGSATNGQNVPTSRGQAGKQANAKKVTPKRVKLMTLLLSICTCIFAIPLAIQGAYDDQALVGIPTMRIAIYDLIILVVISLITQGIYHLMGSTSKQKLIIQGDILKVFILVALAIYGAFRGILYLYM